MAADTLELRKPYLVFLGDASSGPNAKTAYGVRDWAPQACLAQYGLPGNTVDLGLPQMTPEAAAAAGAASLLIGVAPMGGGLAPEWQSVLLSAARVGLDIISGLHTPLAVVPGLVAAAERNGVKLHDVRRPRRTFPVGTGRRRSGKRLLTVGTDCALGKKYTALALERAMRTRGVDATFRATGQTGIMIAGRGIAIDAVVADFIAGAAESLSPDAPATHWDVIEGQGSLFHPSYAGVTLGLLHGSQPDVLILCHDPTRAHMQGLPGYPLPPLDVACDLYLQHARLTNPFVRLAGVSLNTSQLDEAQRARVIGATVELLGVPVFDPLRTPLDAAVERILSP
jgi:uncharacterized NAD-dependent epimerase/dehydratase family protein